MSTSNIFDLADTWNDAAVTFNGIKLNVTDTASDAASNLLDLQVGGASRFSVGKGAGAIFGTNLIEQRNSTNPQEFRLYNTFTDASNFERGFMKWNSNVLEIGTERDGTGSARNVNIISGDRIAFFRTGQGSPPTFRHRLSNVLDIFIGSSPNPHYSFNTTFAFQLDSGMQFAWGSGRADTVADAGIKRDSAGVVKVTNGSTGTGELIFIVPTTDPGITGALWNDAGTLSISAG